LIGQGRKTACSRRRCHGTGACRLEHTVDEAGRRADRRGPAHQRDRVAEALELAPAVGARRQVRVQRGPLVRRERVVDQRRELFARVVTIHGKNRSSFSRRSDSRPMEPRPHRAELQLEGLGDLLVRQALEVTQHHHDPPVLAELADRAVQGRLELASLGFFGGALGGRRYTRQRFITVAGDAPLARRQPVQAQTRGNRVEPRRELGLAAELADGAVHAEKDLLGEILGFRPVAEHPERHAEDAVLVSDHQVLERPGVAAPEPLHQDASSPVDPSIQLDHTARRLVPPRSISTDYRADALHGPASGPILRRSTPRDGRERPVLERIRC
jgi:hypothetical protein